jgi:hypothetical protein
MRDRNFTFSLTLKLFRTMSVKYLKVYIEDNTKVCRKQTRTGVTYGARGGAGGWKVAGSIPDGVI